MESCFIRCQLLEENRVDRIFTVALHGCNQNYRKIYLINFHDNLSGTTMKRILSNNFMKQSKKSTIFA